MAKLLNGGALIALSIALACGGCSSDSSENASGPSPAATSASDAGGVETEAAQAEDVSGGGDFCTLYATRVAQGLVDIRNAEAGNVEDQTQIAERLAAEAPVSQSQLQAVAPPEPLAWLQEMEEADAKSAAGDFSALDATFGNLGLLTDWAIANCDAEYTAIFTEYKTIIG
ncbi:hypothetical protein QMK17_18095 [Rhodococcus sp. G-MC3]|uniref:hypothetical protein n=1 Tax=Rhodococcus sp. G-MC3 TaxID=3046209 RepID=UPI0024B87BEC|nr:hypothetical protein [Rhodococcus sp. G-MC3]MDJ0395241.1 hypothetical protein [Rhodococcus sp. G-MC3]